MLTAIGRHPVELAPTSGMLHIEIATFALSEPDPNETVRNRAIQASVSVMRSRLKRDRSVLSYRDEGAEEIDGCPSPEFFVEGLVAVAAKASVARGLCSAVAPRDTGQRCVQHLVERTGKADCAVGSAGHRVEDHKRGALGWRRVEGSRTPSRIMASSLCRNGCCWNGV